MINYQSVSGKVETYVRQYFNPGQDSLALPYHNLAHTERVVAAAQQIANHYQLGEQDFFIVNTAAWFHDTGYYIGDGTDHELKGAALAADYLRTSGVDETTIGSIRGCILATRLPQHPESLNEKIVCDADLFHLGTDEFPAIDKLMRKEYAKKGHEKPGKDEWRLKSIQFLEAHHYHTDYCQLLLNGKKMENIQRLKNKLKNNEENNSATEAGPSTAVNTKGAGLPAVPVKKADRPIRGIETMFRVASTNHQRLSDMADSKANIMISVNSIIISVVLSLLVRRLETAQHLIAPTLILLIGTVVAIIFSILATRPKIPNGYFSQEQLASRKVNLLFFGNFYKMDFDHYYEGMQEVMKDGEFLYASLIRDIHSQGIVLGNKYKLLRISYTVFMFTLIVSIIAFAVAIIFFG